MKWWNISWNPVVGCTPVSPGCDNCYANALHGQRHAAFLAGKQVPACYSRPFGEVRCLPERLDAPLRWRKPRRVFVNSMSDLFHPGVPFLFKQWGGRSGRLLDGVEHNGVPRQQQSGGPA